jgi:hypothetical protein
MACLAIFLLIIETLVLMIKKTGTACIATPNQTSVFIVLIFKVYTCYQSNTIPN